MTLNFNEFMAKMKAKFDEFQKLKQELDIHEQRDITRLTEEIQKQLNDLIEETKKGYTEKRKELEEKYKVFFE